MKKTPKNSQRPYINTGLRNFKIEVMLYAFHLSLFLSLYLYTSSLLLLLREKKDPFRLFDFPRIILMQTRARIALLCKREEKEKKKKRRTKYEH